MNSLSWPSERRKVSPLLPPQQISTTDVRALKEDVDMEDTEILETLPISAYKLLYYMDGGEFSNRNLPELATQCHHARNWKPFLDHITKGSKMASMSTLSAPPSVNDTQEYSEDDLATAAFGIDLASMKGWEIAASDICKDRLLLQALRDYPRHKSLMKDIERMLGSMRQVAPPAERPHQEYNDAFNKAYLGQDYQALNRAIRRMDGLKYTRILPIVQSSGMGKSKLMLKISEEIVVLQACICGNDESNGSSVPAQDPAVYNYLMAAPKAEIDLDGCKGHMQRFLWAAFSAASQYIQQNNLRAQNQQMAIDHFREIFTDFAKRSAFWQRVVTKARGCNKLVEIMKQELSTNKIVIVLCLDEVHTLYPQVEESYTTGRDKHTAFSCFKSAFAEFSSLQELRAVVLSTYSGLRALAPPRNVATSLRERKGEPHAPFCLLPLDIHRRESPLLPDKYTLNECGTLDMLTTFGRPLWRTYYEAYPLDRGSTNISHIMTLVKSKILCQYWQPPSIPLNQVRDSARIFSIMLARLHLTPFPTVLGRSLELDSVKSHLRVLYRVEDNGEYFWTGSPSEPIVAIGCAELMHMTTTKTGVCYFDFWDHLIEYIQRHECNGGRIGKLLGRALSIIAMDRVILHGTSELENPLRFGQSIRLLDYYQALLTDEEYCGLKQSYPANRSNIAPTLDVPFEEAFKDAYLHFSHYTLAGDSGPLETKYLWALWLRGCAVQTHGQQELTDRVIPIFFFAPNATVGPGTCSCILDQDKTGVTVSPELVSIQDAGKLHIFDANECRPYIDAVHCYAKKTQSERTSGGGGEAEVARKAGTKAPRYRIVLRGLKSYRAVDDSLKAQLLRLMSQTRNPVTNNIEQANLD